MMGIPVRATLFALVAFFAYATLGYMGVATVFLFAAVAAAFSDGGIGNGT